MNIGLCVPLTRSRLDLELPLPVVVGVAWGRSTSSFHEGAEKWARAGFESRHAFVILCNKSAVTPPARRRPIT